MRYMLTVNKKRLSQKGQPLFNSHLWKNGIEINLKNVVLAA